MRTTAVLICLAALAIGAPTTGAASTSGGNVSQKADSSRATLQALGHGKKFKNSGEVAIKGQLNKNGVGQSGAVFLKVLPTFKEITKYAPGQSVPRIYSAYQAVDSSGNFELRIDRSTLPQKYMAQDGQVDVELTASDGSSDIIWFTSLRAPTKRGAHFAALASDDGSVATVTVDFGKSTVNDGSLTPESLVSSDGVTPASAPDLEAVGGTAMSAHSGPAFNAAQASLSDAPSGSSRATAAVPAEICQGSWGSTYQNSSERWANIYGVLAPWNVTLSNGNSHTLGIAYKGGQSGTLTISASTSSSTTAAQATLYNTVQYRPWYDSCYPNEWWKPYAVVTLMSSYSQIAIVNYPYCTAVAANVTYTKNTSSNLTFSGGVSIKGVGLTAKSGWDSAVRMSMAPTRNGYVCGNSSVGWSGSSNVSNQVTRP